MKLLLFLLCIIEIIFKIDFTLLSKSYCIIFLVVALAASSVIPNNLLLKL